MKRTGKRTLVTVDTIRVTQPTISGRIETREVDRDALEVVIRTRAEQRAQEQAERQMRRDMAQDARRRPQRVNFRDRTPTYAGLPREVAQPASTGQGAPQASDEDVVVAYLVYQGHGPAPDVRAKVKAMSPDWRKGVAATIRAARADM